MLRYLYLTTIKKIKASNTQGKLYKGFYKFASNIDHLLLLWNLFYPEHSNTRQPEDLSYPKCDPRLSGDCKHLRNKF